MDDVQSRLATEQGVSNRLAAALRILLNGKAVEEPNVLLAQIHSVLADFDALRQSES
jgi:hypothetical protein